MAGQQMQKIVSKIISIENVDGLLVGGASLKKSDFEIICSC